MLITLRAWTVHLFLRWSECTESLMAKTDCTPTCIGSCILKTGFSSGRIRSLNSWVVQSSAINRTLGSTNGTIWWLLNSAHNCGNTLCITTLCSEEIRAEKSDQVQLLIFLINGELTQPRRQRQWQRQKIIGSMSKTIALHVHHAFNTYLCPPVFTIKNFN